MEHVKNVLGKIDFRINVGERTLTISYGDNSIILRLTEENKVKLELDVTLEGILEETMGNVRTAEG